MTLLGAQNVALGTDVSTPVGANGLPDLDPFFSLVTGRAALAQALLRRIITPTGALLGDPSYGHDVRVHLNDVAVSPRVVAVAVREQWLADERVVDCGVRVTFADGTYRIEGLVRDGDGPFRLVIAIGEVTAEILEAA